MKTNHADHAMIIWKSVNINVNVQINEEVAYIVSCVILGNCFSIFSDRQINVARQHFKENE